MAGLIRVTALAVARRRAGFAFAREPLIIGAESLGTGIEALRRLAAIVNDPALIVERCDEDEHGVFIAITDTDRQALADLAISVEAAADDDDARAAIETIVEGLIGDTELQEPERSEGNGGGAAASTPTAEKKAKTVAKPRGSSGRQSKTPASTGVAQG